MQDAITSAERELENRFAHVISQTDQFDRQTVSYQASKSEPGFRWFHFKEAFSPRFVRNILKAFDIDGPVCDPFAGTGTTLFVAAAQSLQADGMERLPVATTAIRARSHCYRLKKAELAQLLDMADKMPWKRETTRAPLGELSIARDAYPEENQVQLEKFLAWISHTHPRLAWILHFAGMCVLERCSYTSKHGQFLRWDGRSKHARSRHDKGNICEFSSEVSKKIREIIADIPRLPPIKHQPGIWETSCLNLLDTWRAGSYQAVITSPPYCNRYDYTRIYALELSYLGFDDDDVRNMRQDLLCATVENRPKQLSGPCAQAAQEACQKQRLLSLIVKELESRKTINNPAVPRMIRHYFLELAATIAGMHRWLRPGGVLVMVNDNVRYEGLHVPVDLILSDIAQSYGFRVEHIWSIPQAKGNSSQQMAKYGNLRLRKGIYVWRKQ